MKDQLKLLLGLQTIDLELDEKQVEMERIQQQLQEHKDILQKLTDDLQAQKAGLDEAVTLKARRDEELREAEERHARSKERLMNVSSAKEYNALEKEMEQLKRMADSTREQLEHLKESITINREAIAEKESKINELSVQIDDTEKEAAGKIASLDKDLDAVQQRRKAAEQAVKKPILRRYDFIRNRRGGSAIVAAKNSHCEGCFMRVPPQLVIELQRGNTLIACPSCQRILYHEDIMAEDNA